MLPGIASGPELDGRPKVNVPEHHVPLLVRRSKPRVALGTQKQACRVASMKAGEKALCQPNGPAQPPAL